MASLPVGSRAGLIGGIVLGRNLSDRRTQG
jgi:hypothetical protein